jgi:myo-inositol-1(or 4)-monophosphatase
LRANEDLALIEQTVREAGEIARHFYGKEYRRWSKRRGEPVTEADIAIDKFLRGVLEKSRPDYGWLSEETGKNLSRLNTERMFIVDPIDGTTAFLKERPHFSISIGIAEKGRSVAGVVYNPILDECFAAFAGGGARLNGGAIHVSACSKLEGCRIVGPKDMFAHRTWSEPPLEPWPSMHIESRSSVAYRMALVAAGRFDAAVILSAKHDWDMAAGDVIVREAGGGVTDKDGNALFFGRADAVQRTMVCAGPALHAQILTRLRHLDLSKR